MPDGKISCRSNAGCRYQYPIVAEKKIETISWVLNGDRSEQQSKWYVDTIVAEYAQRIKKMEE